ncbi:MAG TPA: diacylglycerol kinase family protein [Candidatus Aquilonibacter sp.]|nr:diacylglycerol kinase family protein [Candidatus Aquilonibacter sp.]
MRKVALLYNPDSGGRREKRKAQLESVLALLRAAAIEVELRLPHSPSEAQELTRNAIQNGCDTVFAGGGDGTIHNIVQVLANTPVALAILPLGTANALAHDLGLPMNVCKAAQALAQPTRRRIALGRIHYRDLADNPAARFFVVAAGAGVDAHLFYKLLSGDKERMGMAAYYAKAWHLWFTHPMTRFSVEFSDAGSQEKHRANVTELLAVRIRNFGGVVQELAPGASLARNDMRLVLSRTASRLAYLAYVTRGLLRRDWKVPGVDLAYTDRVSCSYSEESSSMHSAQETRPKVYIEADGELVGTLPAEITVVQDALTLLAPSP